MKSAIFALLVVITVSSLSFAGNLGTPGIYNCSDLKGSNKMILVIGAKASGGHLYKTVTIFKNQISTPVDPRRVYMSEEEHNEFSVWFLDENGNRKTSAPSTYCLLTAAQG